MRDVLRHRDLRLLLFGQTVSQAGDWLYTVALVVYVIDATGSAAWVAAVELARTVPWIILGPLGGLLADRMDRRRLLIACDLVQFVGMLVLAAVAAAGGHPVATVVIAAIAASTQVVQGPALMASIPSLVNERGLASVNAVLSAIMNIAIVVGPAVGAVLLVLGSPAAAFGLNAITFGVSAVSCALIRTPMGPSAVADLVPVAPDGAGAGPAAQPGAAARSSRAADTLRAARHEVAAGAVAIRRSPAALAAVAVAAAALFAYGMEVVLWVLLADERLTAGAEAITLLYVANGIGGLLATVPASRAAGGQSAARILALGAVVGGVSVAALAMVAGLPPAMALIGIQGFVISIVDVMAITIVQRALGPAILGRALGAMDSITCIALVCGTLLAPLVIGLGGLEAGFVVAGLALSAVGLLAATAARRETAPAPALENRVALLGSLSLFAGAPRFALEALAAECQEISVPGGADVITEGDVPDALYVIVDGAAVVTTGSERLQVNAMTAGDFFGEIGLVKRVPRTATVTTTAPSTLLRIEGETFLSLVHTGVAQRRALGRSVGVRLAAARDGAPGG